MTNALRWCLCLAAASLLAPQSAKAGNDDEILLGNDAAMMGGAVVATVSDGSGLWYNPAGLARASDDKVDVSASAFTLRHYKLPKFLSFDENDTGEGKTSFTEFLSIPSALTYVRRFSPTITAGIGLFASHYNDTSFHSGAAYDAGRVEGDIGLHVSAEIARYHLVGGVGIRLSPRWSFGVALSGDYETEGTALGISSTSRLGKDLVGAQSSSAFYSGMILGFHARTGLTFQATDRLKLGVSAELPGVYFYRNQRTDSTQVTAIEGESPEGNVVTEKESTTDFGLYAPVRVRFGAALDVGGGTIALEGDVASKVHDAVVEVDRVLNWNVRAGARFPISERYRIGVGAFTDRSPDRKDEAGAGPVHFYGGTLGLQYENMHLLAAKAGEPTKGMKFSSTVALRYAYGSGRDYAILVTDEGGEDSSTKVHEHEITLHIGSGLYF